MKKIYPYTQLGSIMKMSPEALKYAKNNFPTEECKNASVGARNNVFDKIATRYLVNNLMFPYSKEAGTVLRWCFANNCVALTDSSLYNLTIEEAMFLVSERKW